MKTSYTGINIQFPISQLIMSGEKIIETRTYKLPEQFENVELLIIETPGKKGAFKSRIVGSIIFSGSFLYKSKQQFYKDYPRHCVDKNSDWAWKDKAKWGWIISKVSLFEKPRSLEKRPGIVYTKDIQL